MIRRALKKRHRRASSASVHTSTSEVATMPPDTDEDADEDREQDSDPEGVVEQPNTATEDVGFVVRRFTFFSLSSV